jgi:hypothetical protein
MRSNHSDLTDSPTKMGVGIGVLLGVFRRFVHPIEFPTATFLIAGIVLTQFGEKPWPDIGRAFVFLSISNAVVWLLLRLAFGGPWF